MNASRKRKARQAESIDQRHRRLENSRAWKKRSTLRCQTVSELVQSTDSSRRLHQIWETKARNAVAQAGITPMKPKGRKKVSNRNQNTRQQNRADFFKMIDEPLAYICGACGELSDAKTMKVYEYDETQSMFQILRVSELCDGIIPEAVVNNANGSSCVPFCKRCREALVKKRVPKFSMRSGFCLSAIPYELAVLNDAEARMISLGICFISCFRLKGGGQRGTRGNAISYWNDSCSLVTKLPRPPTKCGVVHLRVQGEHSSGRVFDVRPHYLRCALLWLVENNELYNGVQIDEKALQDLQQSQAMLDLTIDASDVSTESLDNTNAVHDDEVGQSFVESYEMNLHDDDNSTESQRMRELLGGDFLSDSQVPNVSIRESTRTLNEYTSKFMMQQCFPTLFPNGRAGLHAQLQAC
jgi:hypothetical protein